MKRLILFFIMMCATALSQATGLVDLKFGRYQIADSQWNTGACLYTTTCQIYSKNPGTAYKIPWWSGQISWAPGDYIQFQSNAHKDANNPWLAVHYSSNGTAIDNMGTGHIINMGPDFFFFVGNDNDTGQLFSLTTGMSNTNGITWTGTLNPTVQQVDSYAANGSTTPLAAGQSAPPPAPSGPTIEGGTITQTNAPTTQTITSGGSSSAGATTEQQTRYNTWNNGTQSVNNYLYIEQIGGNYNTVNITQSGTKNTMYLGVSGSSNNVDATQTGVNYLNALVQGNTNTVTSLQTNTAGSNYQETKIMNGNSNTIQVSQKDNGNNLMFNTVTGNGNTITAVQEGGGNHYLENKLTGNGNTVLANQFGSTGNKANIDLTNAGGAASVDLQQSGGKSFTIIQGCTNPAGCTTVVRQ
jgi:Curlin associated repeat